MPKPSAAAVEGGFRSFRKVASWLLIRRRLKCRHGGFRRQVSSEVEIKSLNFKGVFEALRDAFETSQGSRGGRVIGQHATVSDLLLFPSDSLLAR